MNKAMRSQGAPARPLGRAALAALLLLLAAVLLAAPARAQFSMVPAPLTSEPPRASQAEDEKAYRLDAARHIYAAYPMRIMRGKMPPLLYGVMMVETEIDAQGQVLDVQVIRKPAAPEVGPWVLAMIRRAGPFPPPARVNASSVKFMEIWLVDKSGLFQLDALTEGQR